MIKLSKILILTIVCLSSCHPKTIDQTTVANLPDGIYLVTQAQKKKPKSSTLKEGELIVKYNYRFNDKTAEAPEYIVLVKDEFVPLTLKSKPETVEQEDKRKKLNLELTPAAKQRLTDFTTKYLNQSTAIVIKGEAVTLHKVRAVIDGGFLQITRCTDNACEFLYAELQDNVVKEEQE